MGIVNWGLNFLSEARKDTFELGENLWKGKKITINPTDVEGRRQLDALNYLRSKSGEGPITQDTHINGLEYFGVMATMPDGNGGFTIERGAQLHSMLKAGAVAAAGIVGFKATQGAISVVTGDW